jgi:hypothetical protein
MNKKIFGLVFLTLGVVIYNFQGKTKSVEKTKEVKTVGALSEIINTTNVTQIADSDSTQTAVTSSTLNLKTQYFFDEIPKKSSLKDATDYEVHTMPLTVREAGEYLSEMREFFVKHPQPAKDEMAFYLKCATHSELFDSIRAVCAARTDQKYKELTGRNISPLVFGKTIGELKRYVRL